MGVYKYDATNDELIPIAGAPSTHELEDKVSTYTADATYWDTTPTAASTKPVISDGIKTQFDLVHNELSDVNNILGSKNILPNSATTQVINGITYTVAADGSVNVNGTATADSILHIVPGTIGKLSNIFSKGGNYIISVGTTGSGVDVFFGIEYTGSTWDIAEWLKYSTQLSKEIYIDGTQLNNSLSYIESYIKVNSGTTVSNIKVYPMLRPSSVRDDTYVSYSKTNYELTTEISNFENLLDQKSNLLLVQSISKSITGNGQRYRENTYDVRKTGYTPIGVVGWNVGNVDWYINCAIRNNASVYVMAMRNDNTTWSGTFNFNVEILYLKNS